ncbi:putative extracellular alkaline serine protease protein [Colletotrichum karsti]|uniref:Extracellular alkaline serine protease protein n=1 Tax=Colletotrichum karsti TaxID=1095194 RepID=A0A9P6LPN2_9PEZI|nr:putative extracellular alkaline serine protease protein [Colletotrichum karsti]KAF9880591.1 putative extracellular alkaline serine protease protein [Colletotrichum karsti]
MEVYSDSELWEEKDTFGPFKELIGVCLKADPFNQYLNNPQQVRDALARQVAEGTCAETLSSLANGVSGATNPAPSSDKWFDQLQKLSSVTRLPPKRRDASYHPAKIAVLDTGLHPSFSAAGYEDFVDRANETSQDGSGHGTSAFQLLQRVYSDAQIFVGRVWRTNRASDNTASLMAKVTYTLTKCLAMLTDLSQAIRHAITKWAVDIIVMPSGFQAEHEDMLRAIEEANAAHILIFAAASNHGNLIDIAFPARLYRAGKLFCMFSTDVNARSLPAFNPSPLPGANSFAILGENITLGNSAPLSGTSFSAVIAAALAGRIIDFSRHPDTRDLIRRPGHLKRVEGMASVFGKMARTDNSYRCIAPWRLLPQMEDEDLLDPVNRSQRRCTDDEDEKNKDENEFDEFDDDEDSDDDEEDQDDGCDNNGDGDEDDNEDNTDEDGEEENDDEDGSGDSDNSMG